MKLKNLKTIRKASGLSQEQAAAVLETPLNTYRNWEQNRNSPNSEMLLRICDLFGCTLDELAGREEVAEHATLNIPTGESNLRTVMEDFVQQELYTIAACGTYSSDYLHEVIELGKWLVVNGEGGDEMTETIGARIAALRGERGWTARQLARKADLADESVLSIEAGTGNPTIKTLEKIADALECTVSDLIGD